MEGGRKVERKEEREERGEEVRGGKGVRGVDNCLKGGEHKRGEGG